MIVLASEDIGNADPQALQVAVAAAQAVEHVGMPECALNLSQAAVYLALAPKSNASCTAILRARRDIKQRGRAASSFLSSGRSLFQQATGPALHAGRVLAQPARRSVRPELMPEGMDEQTYYEPRQRGFERELQQRLDWLRKQRERGN